jgi:hypothetical protein
MPRKFRRSSIGSFERQRLNNMLQRTLNSGAALAVCVPLSVGVSRRAFLAGDRDVRFWPNTAGDSTG